MSKYLYISKKLEKHLYLRIYNFFNKLIPIFNY